MGYLSPISCAFWREVADSLCRISERFRMTVALCNADNTVEKPIGLSADDCLNCYPSPDRFVSKRRLPVTPFSILAKNCYRVSVGLAFSLVFTDSRQIITPIKGYKSCLRHPTSSQQLRFSVSQLVWNQTASARLLAQALAALLAKHLATTTALKAHLLAASLVHFPTTSKVTRHLLTTEFAATGHPCVRRFCI